MEKYFAYVGIMICLKFIKEESVFSRGIFFFAVVEFLRS
jgi:hypothetical protein